MSMLSNKKSLIIAVIVLVLAAIFLYKKMGTNVKTSSLPSAAPSAKNDSPMIVSTQPDPLEDATIPATGQIEITFNRPLQNVGEFKSRIESNTDYKVILSQDRKTAIISWQKPLELGTSFTLFIEPDTKFDGVGAWGQEKVFHFRTIKYTGV